MSNSVYLYCTDFSELPTESQFEYFFKMSGTEYEAISAIPLFWLCLFSDADVRIFSSNGEFDLPEGEPGDNFRPYAYLCCSKTMGIERLKNRESIMCLALGEKRFSLYEEWISRLEAEPFKNIMVRTEELDWMGEEGELEEQLRQAFKDLDNCYYQEKLFFTVAMTNIMGLWERANPKELDAYLLVGTANDAQGWPPQLMIDPVTPTPESMLPTSEKKSKWFFWKK